MAKIGKIILVEDDELDADMTQRTLKAIPIANPIIWLETGQELIEYLDAHGSKDITLVILDLKMPVMSGLEALEVIKGNKERFGYFPIVVLTSSQEQPEIRRCYELGINSFVTKPVAQAAFRDAVKTLGLFWGLLNVRPE